MKLSHAGFLLLALPLFVHGSGQNPPLTKAEKDSLLSRKKWYLSYEFTRDGSGGGTSPVTGEISSWSIHRHAEGTVEINFPLPGMYPPSTPAEPDFVLQTGRFIGWMTIPSEAVAAAMGRGETDPAKLPGQYYPMTRQVRDRYENRLGPQWRKETYTLDGEGYAMGPVMLAFDLKEGTYDLVFTAGPMDFGPQIKDEWQSDDGSGSREMSPNIRTCWMANSMLPQLAKRKIRQDMKSDGSIVFTISGTDTTETYPQNVAASFRISPTPPTVAELTLEPADEDYKTSFRPEPGKSETERGNYIEVDWAVTEKGVPEEKRAKVVKVTFRLGNVSRYPGVCMNWPPGVPGPNAPKPKPDLAFDTAFANLPAHHYIFRDEDQVLFIDGGPAEDADGTIQINVYDGAAIGELVAEAQLSDGRILTGHIKGQPAMNKLVIPDREEGVSDLPKWWRNQWTDGENDESDKEADPEGDKDAPGDGLTVWEEYRGFFEGGAWTDGCNPKKKDLFIHNKIGASAQGGIDLFSDATGLIVHDQLKREEYRMDRVVNYLNRGDRHSVDQTCLILVPGEGSFGHALGLSGKRFPGPPKNTYAVYVLMGLDAEDRRVNMAPGVCPTRNQQARHIAHELGHGIGIYHHGDRDPWTNGAFGIPWFARATFGRTQIVEGSEGGSEVFVYLESNVSLSPEAIFLGGRETFARVGRHFGQHSGDADCIMRYNVARYYERTGTSNQYYVHADEEPPGGSLCTSSGGTLFNFPTNQPQSRYGGADTLRGDCAHQFVINDKYDKKYRDSKEQKAVQGWQQP